MIKRTLEELEAYDAPGHFKMTAMRIHGKEAQIKVKEKESSID